MPIHEKEETNLSELDSINIHCTSCRATRPRKGEGLIEEKPRKDRVEDGKDVVLSDTS